MASKKEIPGLTSRIIKVGDDVIFSLKPYWGTGAYRNASAAGGVKDGAAGTVADLRGLSQHPYGATDGYVEVDFGGCVGCLTIYVRHLCPVDLIGGITVEYLEKELAEITAEYDAKISVVKDKISYLKESGAESYSADEAKVWHAISAIEDPTITKMEKVKRLTALVRNGC